MSADKTKSASINNCGNRGRPEQNKQKTNYRQEKTHKKNFTAEKTTHNNKIYNQWELI